jgi:hypothetical protein
VYVTGVRKGVPIAPAAKREIVPVEIRNDMISPSLLVVVAGTTIRFENLVNATVVLSGVLDGRTQYNVPVVPGADGRTVRLDKPGLITFTSRVGPTDGVLRVQVVDNPYVARTGADGMFTLRDLPEGSFEIVALAAGEGAVLLESRMLIGEGEPLALVLAPVEVSDRSGENPQGHPAAGS